MCKSKWLVAVVSCLACVVLSNMVVLVLVFQDLEENDIVSPPRRLDLSFDEAVHVVTTRFMQHQPSLLALGHARLELFKTFCLQTMQYQDTSDFLWLILIDPDLHPELLQGMKKLVSHYPNVYLIRCQTSTIDLQTLNHSLVESGDLHTLTRAAKAVSSKVLINTRLDADDGLDRHVLSTLHTLAVQQLSNVVPSTSELGWASYCIHRHFEWHSIVPTLNQTFTSNPAGNLLLVQKEHCVTPGLTYAFAPGVSFAQLPTAEHQRLGEVIPSCETDNQTACLHRLDEFKGPVAIRARTLTSAGMNDIGRDFNPNISSVPVFWKHLASNFVISRESLIDIQQYLIANVAAIAADNLAGQWYVTDCKRSWKAVSMCLFLSQLNAHMYFSCFVC